MRDKGERNEESPSTLYTWITCEEVRAPSIFHPFKPPLSREGLKCDLCSNNVRKGQGETPPYSPALVLVPSLDVEVWNSRWIHKSRLSTTRLDPPLNIGWFDNRFDKEREWYLLMIKQQVGVSVTYVVWLISNVITLRVFYASTYIIYNTFIHSIVQELCVWRKNIFQNSFYWYERMLLNLWKEKWDSLLQWYKYTLCIRIFKELFTLMENVIVTLEDQVSFDIQRIFNKVIKRGN